MTIYHYPAPAILDEVHFVTSERGSVRAYLHARDGADQKQLYDISCRLFERGFECLPSSYNGTPALEVRGIKRESQLLKFLTDSAIIDGGAKQTESNADKPGFIDSFKKRTLQASGLFYLVGDYNFFSYGRKQSKWEEMLAGVMYFAGTSALVGFGRNDQSDTQVKDLSKKIMRHMIKEGMKLPEDCSLNSITQEEPRSLQGSVHEAFKRYPSEIFNLFTGLAGACVTAGALRHKILNTPGSMDIKAIKRMRLSGWLDVGLGTLTMASTALGGLVEEKAHDPDDPPKHGVQAVMEWVRERPLTVAGAGLMVSTLCHAVSTCIDYKEAKRNKLPLKELGAIKNRGWFVATNLAAELLIALSSKGHGEGIVSDGSVDDSVISLAADIIVHQPAAAQEQLIQYMGGFLGRDDVLAMKDEEVLVKLRSQVDIMRKNPWALADQTGKPAEISAPQTQAIPTPSKPNMPAWQAKLAAQEPSQAIGLHS